MNLSAVTISSPASIVHALFGAQIPAPCGKIPRPSSKYSPSWLFRYLPQYSCPYLPCTTSLTAISSQFSNAASTSAFHQTGRCSPLGTGFALLQRQIVPLFPEICQNTKRYAALLFFQQRKNYYHSRLKEFHHQQMKTGKNFYFLPFPLIIKTGRKILSCDNPSPCHITPRLPIRLFFALFLQIFPTL